MNLSSDTRSAVTVLFRDAALTFVLPREATLAELARQIASMEAAHSGPPVAIAVKLGH